MIKKQKTCQRCESQYLGGSTAKYCYECTDILREEREKIRLKKRYLKNK